MMDNKLASFMSYTLATMAGICFISGIVILSSEGENPKWRESRKYYQCWNTH